MKSAFDDKSKTWDTELKIKRAKRISDEIIKRLPLKPKDEVLEFGCGTGLISFNLLNYAKHFTLLDNSEGMIAVVNEKITKLHLKNIMPVWGDITSNQIIAKRYDALYSSMALHHVIDIEQIGKIFSDLIADNGYLCIVDLTEEDGTFHKDDNDFIGHNGFNVIKLAAVFESYGFSTEYSKVFYKDIKIVDGKDFEYSLFILVMKKLTN